ncbi:hypothetical protein BGW42_005276, partial [Actinomortierella wolfii]
AAAAAQDYGYGSMLMTVLWSLIGAVVCYMAVWSLVVAILHPDQELRSNYLAQHQRRMREQAILSESSLMPGAVHPAALAAAAAAAAAAANTTNAATSISRNRIICFVITITNDDGVAFIHGFAVASVVAIIINFFIGNGIVPICIVLTDRCSTKANANGVSISAFAVAGSIFPVHRRRASLAQYAFHDLILWSK